LNFDLVNLERKIDMLWSIIVGGVIGLIAGSITKKGGSMGVIANIVAGLIGSTVGQSLLGTWGPSLAGMALLPSIIGAVIVVAVFLLSKYNLKFNDVRIQYVKIKKNTFSHTMYFNLDDFDSCFARFS